MSLVVEDGREGVFFPQVVNACELSFSTMSILHCVSHEGDVASRREAAEAGT